MPSNAEAAGWKILDTVTELCVQAFQDRFLAAYAMGSLARGGFSPLASDVDFGLLIRSPLNARDVAAITRIHTQVAGTGLDLCDRLSIFWGSPDSLSGAETGGRFPPFDRLDLLDHALLIKGKDTHTGIPRPTSRELEVEGISFALEYLGAPERLAEYHDPARLLGQGVLYLSKTVLYPARFLYTLQTGRVAGNNVAVDKFVDDNTGADAELVKAAYAWRQGEPLERDSATELLNHGLVPLYLKFLNTYLHNLRGYAETSLASRVEDWIHQLSD